MTDEERLALKVGDRIYRKVSGTWRLDAPSATPGYWWIVDCETEQRRLEYPMPSFFWDWDLGFPEETEETDLTSPTKCARLEVLKRRAT